MRKTKSKQIKRRNPVKYSVLLDELVYSGENKAATTVKLIQYNEKQCLINEISEATNIHSLIKNDSVNWIHICGFSNTALIESIGKSFGLSSMDIKDIFISEHVTKVEVLDQALMVYLKKFRYTDDLILEQENLSLVLGNNFVISFEEAPNHTFTEMLRFVEMNTMRIRTKGADYLFCQLLNSILGGYLDIVTRLGDIFEEMEDQLLTLSDLKNDFNIQMQARRKDYFAIKRSILPLKEHFSKIQQNDNELISAKNMIYVYDLRDRLIYIIQGIDICRETLASLLDCYISNNDLRMNDVMKRLTVISTIFIPLTFIVGLWGMNFHNMPELTWEYGYQMAIGLMVAVTLLVIIYLRRKRWL